MIWTLVLDVFQLYNLAYVSVHLRRFVLGLCDNSKTYISIMHYNIISIMIISR